MLKCDLISLRPLLESDFSLLYQWINDRELVHSNNTYLPVSMFSHKLWFKGRCTNSDGNQYMFIIDRNDTSETIGSCQVNEVKQIERSATLQIRIPSVEQRGKGFGTATVKLLLDFCFNDLNLNRVQIDYFATNVAAQKTYLKSGFNIEGTRRQAAYINGQWVDIIVMGMLRGEYQAQ